MSDEELKHLLYQILIGVNRMSVELDNLTTQVHTNTSTIDSAITLINGIADRITAAGVNPVALNDLVTELRAKDDALAAAVLANTPATPPAPTTPVPTTP